MMEAISQKCPHGIVDFDGRAIPFSKRWLDKEDERVRMSLYARTPAGRAYRRLCDGLAVVRQQLRPVARKLRVLRRKLWQTRSRARSGRGGLR